MIVLYIAILIYFNFNITSIVNVFMLSIEKKGMEKKTAIEKRLGNIQSIKLLLLFEGGFYLLYFHLNCDFHLRVAYVRENTICPNIGIYGPEKTPYLDTFHVVTQINERFFAVFETNCILVYYFHDLFSGLWQL